MAKIKDSYQPFALFDFEPEFCFPPGSIRMEKPRITKRPTKDKPWWGIEYRFTVLAGRSMLTQVEE